MTPPRNLDITGPWLNCYSGDEFPRQCYPLFAAWVVDYPEEVMVAHVSSGSWPRCEIPKGPPMGHSTIQPLDDPQD
jgi:hypothetical protein